MADQKKSILITGCSAGGIGATLAKTLAEQGHQVFATARNLDKIPAETRSHKNVTTIQLDVTSAEAVLRAAEIVSKITAHNGAQGLDVLVNNAGSEYTMPILDMDIDTAISTYNSNVWGPLRMVQACADLVIAKRGRIVNVSSADCVLHTPWTSASTSSKAALTNFSETLRIELAPFGVQVVTLLLGTVDTPLHSKSVLPTAPSSSLYSPIWDTIKSWATGQSVPTGMPVQKLVDSITPDILGNRRGGMVWRGANTGAVWFASRWLPTYILDMLVKKDHGFEALELALAEQRQ